MKIRKWLRRKYIAFHWRNAVSLTDLCEAIKPYAYAFVKVDVPYMPDDFPKHVPIGKDADILCSQLDFPVVKKEVTNWAGRFEKRLAVRTINEPYGFRLRLEYYGSLVYQVDIRWKYTNEFSDGFTEEALSRRIKFNDYYVLDISYELMIRVVAYRANQNKQYHLAYISDHISEYNEQLCRRWLKDGVELFDQIRDDKFC